MGTPSRRHCIVLNIMRERERESVCVCVCVALGIQHANRIFSGPYYVVVCGLSGSTMFFFFFHGTIFLGRGGGFVGMKCVFLSFQQLLRETFFVLRKIQRGIVRNVYSSSYSCHILIKFEFFSDRFSTNPQIPYFVEIRPMGAELLRAHEQT